MSAIQYLCIIFTRDIITYIHEDVNTFFDKIQENSKNFFGNVCFWICGSRQKSPNSNCELSGEQFYLVKENKSK